MARWTDQEDTKLTECAEAGLSAREASIAVSALGAKRSPSACAGRALKLELSFDSAGSRGLQDFLDDGGRLIREDIGGVVGVRWARAHRSGPGFDREACERRLTLGVIQREIGEIYRQAVAP